MKFERSGIVYSKWCRENEAEIRKMFQFHIKPGSPYGEYTVFSDSILTNMDVEIKISSLNDLYSYFSSVPREHRTSESLLPQLREEKIDKLLND